MCSFEKDIQFNNDMLELVDSARNRFIPIMLTKTSKLLFNIVKENQPKNILEIGTAIGYSGIVMLKANPNAFITTIEFNQERAIEAKENFAKFGFENRVEIINNDALEALALLKQQNKKFDFVFLDGPKGQYLKYFEIIENILTKNAIVVVDDILFKYNINKGINISHKNRAMLTKLRTFVCTMQSNPKYDVQIYNFDEGIMVIQEKQQ